MKGILLFLLLSSLIISCGREVEENAVVLQQEFKYKGIYIGQFKKENGNNIGDFSFTVFGNNDIYINKFNMNFNEFIVNITGVRFEDTLISDDGKFTTKVYSFDNFNNKEYRGTIEGSLSTTNINGNFQFRRSMVPNETTITKGTLTGNKQ